MSIFLILGALALVILSSMVQGFVLSMLWEWFITEWFGIWTITIPEAMGIALIVNLLTSNLSHDDPDIRNLGDSLIVVFLVPLFLLLLGALFHAFMVR